MATILRFSFTVKKTDWSNSEQAEFARAAALLRRSGLQIACEWGLSDEGDPWTIFMRHDTGDVIAHIARIDGRIYATSTASADVVAGPNLRSVMDRIMRSQPLVLLPPDQGSQLHVHPATVLLAFIATAFVWSQKDDDAQHYEWRVGSAGGIEVEVRGHATASPGASLLRDAVLSKAEIGRLGLDARFALSDSMALAAATAALALAVATADTFDFHVGTPLAELEEFRQAPELHVAFRPDDGDAPRPNGDHVAVTLAEDVALHDEADLVQPRPLPEPGHGSAPASPTVADAGDNHFHIEQVSAPDHMSVPVEPPKAVPVMLVGETTAGKNAAPSVPEPAAEAVASSAHDDARPVHGSPLIFASDAGGQLLALMFGVKQASDLPASLTPSAIEHEFSGLSGIGPVGAGPSSTGQPGAAASPAANGFELLSEIISFAFNPAHELSPPAAELQLFQQTVTTTPFLPTANRILIIDMPDLQADIFKFSGGLAMMSQRTAEKLLPDMPMIAQSELPLLNGMVLKLIGVVDLHPDQHLS